MDEQTRRELHRVFKRMHEAVAKIRVAVDQDIRQGAMIDEAVVRGLIDLEMAMESGEYTFAPEE